METGAFEKLANYIKNKIAISQEDLDQIRSRSMVKKLRKKQYLLQEGDVWSLNVFVANGCLRIYSVDDSGLEHILNFAIENWWIGDRESLTSGNPSKFNIDAIEDSEVVIIKEGHFDQLRKEIPLFNQMVNDVFHRSFISAQNRLHAAISYSAEEKYLNFLETYPYFAARIPQSMIASYLGISAETLSRVRNRASKQK